jgi:preprotein translocase subunit SecE
MGFIQYLKDTATEMKHVSWPTQKQTTIFTVLVIVISLLTAAYLGVFDYIFSKVLEMAV